MAQAARKFVDRRTVGDRLREAWGVLTGEGLAARTTRSVVDYLTRFYRGSEVNRHNERWRPLRSSADADLMDGVSDLHGRSRWLAENEPFSANAVRTIVKNTVATGITAKAAAEVDGERDSEFNSLANQLFEDWAEEEADVSGRDSWWEVQSLALSAALEDGQCFLRLRFDADPDRLCPVTFQKLEADYLDTRQDRPRAADGTRVVGGIRINDDGRVISYFFHPGHPRDIWAGYAAESVEVPAAEVIPLLFPTRLVQTHGRTYLAPVIQTARDLDNLISNELAASYIASLFVAAVYEEYSERGGTGLVPVGGSAEESDAQGNPLFRLGRGIVSRMGSPDKNKVEILESKRPSQALDPFAKLILLQNANGVGLSYAQLYGDHSAVSYSGGRMGAIGDRAVYKPLQRQFARRLVKPAWRAVMDGLAARGRFESVGVSAQTYFAAPRRWRRCELGFPGWEQVDPEKETAASLARLAGGLSNFQAEYASRGLDWKRELAQLASELTYIRDELGIDLQLTDLVTGGRGGAARRRNAEEAAA